MRKLIVACGWLYSGVVDNITFYQSYISNNYNLSYFQHITDTTIPSNPNVHHFLINCDNDTANDIWQDDKIFVLEDVEI